MKRLNLLKSAVDAVGSGGRSNGFLASTLGGAFIGSMAGAVMGGSDGRWSGAIGGGLTGVAAGAGISRFAAKGSSFSQGMLQDMKKRGGARIDEAIKSGKLTPDSPVVKNFKAGHNRLRNAVRGFHKKENRNAIFRSGALLGGGAFGLMFAGNGKSHKRGFNANRGNGFRR
jgi:hypothetical protein